jgi:thiol:disulfide interchange protein DsbD
MGLFSIISRLLFGLVLMTAAETSAQPQRVGPVTVVLVAERPTVQPGTPFRVGLYLVPDEHWHLYWRNPGDAGLPPTLRWDLPEGFRAGSIDFPAPIRIPSGPLAAYGYHGPALYPVTITPPADLQVGSLITLNLEADWLVCMEECLPGSATLSLTLPVSEQQPPPDQQSIFESALRRLPQSLPTGWLVLASADASGYRLDIAVGGSSDTNVQLEFFAADKGVIEHAAEQPVTAVDASRCELRLVRSAYSQGDPDTLAGVLAVMRSSDTTYYEVAAPLTSALMVAAAATTTSFSPLLAVLFAFLGGLILNLMPCVLPVLSLKVLGLVEQAGQGRRAALAHGGAFTAGVVVSFWVIVAVMLLLQAGGAQLGWGFQLQSPIFVLLLAAFMFLFALSLFGVFVIGLPGAVSDVVSSPRRSGLGGAFISGVVATLVATPCTAPFMGAALGYSLTQPVVMSLLIYTSLALGMASPYLVLSIFPRFLRFVPKPGRWMETLKQAMGFLLAATVIWLGWVLASQAA